MRGGALWKVLDGRRELLTQKVSRAYALPGKARCFFAARWCHSRRPMLPLISAADTKILVPRLMSKTA